MKLKESTFLGLFTTGERKRFEGRMTKRGLARSPALGAEPWATVEGAGFGGAGEVGGAEASVLALDIEVAVAAEGRDVTLTICSGA